jgi:hypothetical protein
MPIKPPIKPPINPPLHLLTPFTPIKPPPSSIIYHLLSHLLSTYIYDHYFYLHLLYTYLYYPIYPFYLHLLSIPTGVLRGSCVVRSPQSVPGERREWV